ncbi:hypothetical protein [Accumulibacter sp.]|uniref:hypothetical protein n=1 Tax=Accumulibacter sp. TaxID=2053492 RepID=UPI0025895608|nr:hypothetical protein [Accumulibacter sp.]
MAAAVNDQALRELCWLVEQSDPRVNPDAIWSGDQAAAYHHLREIGALTLSNEVTDGSLCRECSTEVFRPVANELPDPEFPYHGYCGECGWIALRKEEAHLWRPQPAKIARWLGTALQLTPHYVPEPAVEGVLWRLGEREFRRRRHVLFFGRRIGDALAPVRDALARLAAPGTEVIITTTDVSTLRAPSLADRLFVPLRAIAHLRKGGLVVENLEAYIPVLGKIQHPDETSLRLLRLGQRKALIDGQEIRLSPQVCSFLTILDDHDGDEVHKQHIAEAMGVDGPIDVAQIFKRHRRVFDTFVGSDKKGHFWLKPDFLKIDDA